MKVLVAEDDAVSRAIARKNVEKLGHECLVAEDGLEAWEVYQGAPDVEVIVSDWMMPGIEGPEFCRRVRALDREGYTFFIFLTALSGNEHLLQGMEAGADEYLTKPLDSERLRITLDSAARVTSLHQHLYAGTDRDSDGPGHKDQRTVSADRRRGSLPKAGKAWDILLSQGKISEEQLQKALEAQKNNRMDLGKTLVSLGYISEKDLAMAQAQRLRLDYVDLDEAVVDRSASALIPEKMLRKHDALPLSVEDNTITVAMSDPADIYALEDLQLVSGRRVVPVVASEKSLSQARNRMFSGGEGVAALLEDAASEEEGGDEVELDAGAGPEEAPVVRVVDSILKSAVAEGASDVHVEPHAQGLSVRLRVDGVLREIMSIPSGLQGGVVARLKILANLDIAERRLPQDGRFSVRLGGAKVDLRVAVLPTVHGEGVVIRLLDTSNLQTDLSGLGLSPRELDNFRGVFQRAYGMILVTGPTGSGKSTTLYATLGELNSPEKKIITVEDPVEYRLKGVNQIQVNPRAGLTFASGLRSILRNDPDIVMIGEIRDAETAKTSIEAALTGHMVLATLHTNNAPGALSRLTDMGVEPFLTASSVNCVVAQRLARRLCERCKQPVEIEQEILESMNFPFKHTQEEGLRLHKAVGCQRCGGSGYRGRVGIYEIMLVTREIEEMILHRASAGEIAEVAERDGMVRLRDDGLLKAAEGVTSIEEVLRTVV